MIAVALHNQVQVTTLTHDACVPWWQTRQELQEPSGRPTYLGT